ncbi:hypothetical protein P7C70_g9473, partial [Phenoliferia sp. Uapishka_3]
MSSRHNYNYYDSSQSDHEDEGFGERPGILRYAPPSRTGGLLMRCHQCHRRDFKSGDLFARAGWKRGVCKECANQTPSSDVVSRDADAHRGERQGEVGMLQGKLLKEYDTWITPSVPDPDFWRQPVGDTNKHFRHSAEAERYLNKDRDANRERWINALAAAISNKNAPPTHQNTGAGPTPADADDEKPKKRSKEE